MRTHDDPSDPTKGQRSDQNGYGRHHGASSSLLGSIAPRRWSTGIAPVRLVGSGGPVALRGVAAEVRELDVVRVVRATPRERDDVIERLA